MIDWMYYYLIYIKHFIREYNGHRPLKRGPHSGWEKAQAEETRSITKLLLHGRQVSPVLQHHHHLLSRTNCSCLQRVIHLILFSWSQFFRCGFVLCAPTGGKCKLSLGTAWRRKGDWSVKAATLHTRENIQLNLLSIQNNLRYTFFLSFIIVVSVRLLYYILKYE